MVTEATSPEFLAKLEARGVSRRSFMKLCGSLAVAAGLTELAAPRIAAAIENSVIGAEAGKLYPAKLCASPTKSVPTSWLTLLKALTLLLPSDPAQ